ncbi:MAG: hypothetical protein WA738_20795, partial [Candidatus Angelobacter sp.]
MAGNFTAAEAGFEATTNQSRTVARFVAPGAGYSVRLVPGEIQLTFDRGSKTQVVPDLVRITLAAADMNVVPQFSDPLPGVIHYYVGSDPSQWRTNIQRFRQVRFPDVYPGIDLLFYSQHQQLEFDFNVAPGKNISAIALRVQGATVREQDGDLQIVTPSGNVAVLQKPGLYQLRDGRRQAINGRYVVRNPQEVAFNAGAYDKELPLVIDPALVYSTLVENILGTAGVNGQEIDFTTAIAVDSTGAAYITGVANDTAFVQKFNATGTAMVYETFMGGSFSHSDAMTVDAAGNAYMVGTTQGSLLPVTAGAFSAVSACEFNA